MEAHLGLRMVQKSRWNFNFLCFIQCYEYHLSVRFDLSIKTECFSIGLFRHTVLNRFEITTLYIYIYIYILVINKKMLLLIAILKPNFINVISSFNECKIVF